MVSQTERERKLLSVKSGISQSLVSASRRSKLEDLELDSFADLLASSTFPDAEINTDKTARQSCPSNKNDTSTFDKTCDETLLMSAVSDKNEIKRQPMTEPVTNKSDTCDETLKCALSDKNETKGLVAVRATTKRKALKKSRSCQKRAQEAELDDFAKMIMGDAFAHGPVEKSKCKAKSAPRK